MNYKILIKIKGLVKYDDKKILEVKGKQMTRVEKRNFFGIEFWVGFVNDIEVTMAMSEEGCKSQIKLFLRRGLRVL